MNRSFLTLLLSVLPAFQATPALADLIVLDSGRKYRVEIVRETDEKVCFRPKGKEKVYCVQRSRVVRLERDRETGDNSEDQQASESSNQPVARARKNSRLFWAADAGTGTTFSGFGITGEFGWRHFGLIAGGGYIPAFLGPSSEISVSGTPGFSIGSRAYLREGDGAYLGLMWGMLGKAAKGTVQTDSSTGQTTEIDKEESVFLGPSLVLGWQWRFADHGIGRVFLDLGISYIGKNDFTDSIAPAFDIGIGAGSARPARRKLPSKK